MTTLKPCPFCGGLRLSLVRNTEYDSWYLICLDCEASIQKSDCHLPDIKILDEYALDDFCDSDDVMELVDSKIIVGLEPLFEAWNRRAK